MAPDATLDPVSAHAVAADLAGAGARYAVVDGARSARILALLRESGARHESLYDGAAGTRLAPWGPYLVELPPESRFAAILIHQGWSRSWGIFVGSSVGFVRLRRHLRRFLMVTTEAGAKCYFRFYDPRVARLFLPMATARQAAALFDEVEAFVMESEDGAAIASFRPSGDAVVRSDRPIGRGSEHG